MADGMLPYRFAAAGASLARRIRVAAHDVDLVASLPSPPLDHDGSGERMLTREDALDVLNLSAPRYRDLVPFERERSSGDARVLSAAEIVGLAAEVVSGADRPGSAWRLMMRFACSGEPKWRGVTISDGSATPPCR